MVCDTMLAMYLELQSRTCLDICIMHVRHDLMIMPYMHNANVLYVLWIVLEL